MLALIFTSLVFSQERSKDELHIMKFQNTLNTLQQVQWQHEWLCLRI